MLEDLKSVKYYGLVLIIVLAGYTWITSKGIRFLGDDNESKENRSGYTRSYYHK